MQRPARIAVLGVLCLVMGALSGIKNMVEGGVCVIGPDTLQGMVEAMEEQQPLPGAQREQMDHQIEVLRFTAYRVIQGLESGVMLIMAGVLIVAGVGLLRDQLWAVRLARLWAYVGLVSALITLGLQLRYPDSEFGSLSFSSMLFITLTVGLPMLWLLPVLLLSLLRGPTLMDYLRAQADRPSGQAQSRMEVADYHAHAQTQDAPMQVAASAHLSADETWRDDPWNEPTSN